MDTISTDFAVVGLGAMGAATLYQLAKRGAKVIGIDRYSPPHSRGASHGRGRVTRSAIGEGGAYVPLVRRSQEILAELEREFDVELMGRTGTLIIGSEDTGDGENFMRRTVEIAEEYGIEHYVLSSSELARRYPQLIGLTNRDQGYFEPKAGFLRPEDVVSLQISAARQLGATIVTGMRVDGISQEGGLVKIRLAGNEIRAKRVVVAAGWWASEILGSPFDRLLKVTRQRSFAFKPEPGTTYSVENMPTLMWFRSALEHKCITVYPQGSGDEGVRFFVGDVDTESEIASAANQFFERHVRPFFGEMSLRLVGCDACYYTSTPDNCFIMDWHPAFHRLLVVSACSGHGFKHSLAIGELAAGLLFENQTSIGIEPFSLQRFG